MKVTIKNPIEQVRNLDYEQVNMLRRSGRSFEAQALLLEYKRYINMQRANERVIYDKERRKIYNKIHYRRRKNEIKRDMGKVLC